MATDTTISIAISKKDKEIIEVFLEDNKRLRSLVNRMLGDLNNMGVLFNSNVIDLMENENNLEDMRYEIYSIGDIYSNIYNDKNSIF
jgi:nitrogen-specific signal transduction histidine kinase